MSPVDGHDSNISRTGSRARGGAAALNLTDEQQDKLFAIQEANRKKNWDTMSSMRSEMFKLRRMYNAESVDSKGGSSARGGRSKVNSRVALLVAATALMQGAVAQSPHTHQHSFSDAEKWAHVFDDPERDAWQKPHHVISALGLKPDAVVADLGAGTGYFAARLANMLPKGTVYAVDLEPDMVKYLGERAKREGLANLKPVQAAAGDARLPAKVDLVLLVDVYHHIEARERYFRKLAASIKPGGRVAVVDLRLDSPEGPPKAARIAPDQVKAELERAGYVLAEEHPFLQRQYFLVFKPRPPG